MYQCVLFPLNPLGFICVRVRETFDLASLATKQTVEIGSDLVALVGLQVVALRTSRLFHRETVLFRKFLLLVYLEQIGAFLVITYIGC